MERFGRIAATASGAVGKSYIRGARLKARRTVASASPHPESAEPKRDGFLAPAARACAQNARDKIPE